MKYPVWFLRLVFAAWMIPAGVNHFYNIFPQPMGSQTLSHELIVALIDSHLFDVVKLVELLAGVAVLTGRHVPLALLVCMPVSFCVFWWDAPLEGWGSRAALFGYSVLGTNLLLCLAYVRSYRSMFSWSIDTDRLALAGRSLLGAWMLVNGVNHFFLGLWTEPAGSAPLAVQLMDAFRNSGLLDVAMTIQLVTGALILAGRFTPAALCVLMPVSTCSVYWATVLDHRPAGILVSLVGFALNGLLMLRHLGYYRSALERHAPSLGEARDSIKAYTPLFTDARGRSPRDHFLPALIILVAAGVFFGYVVTGRTATFCLLVLVYPAAILHARRLRDMGRSPLLLALPVALLLLTLFVSLKYISFGDQADSILPLAALLVAGAFSAWGAAGSSKAT